MQQVSFCGNLYPRGDIKMRKLVLAVIFMAAGSLLADAGTSSFCNLFECKSQDAVHLKAEWTPTIQKMCDSHKNTEGTYTVKFCNIVNFDPSGSVTLKDLYVEDFKELCAKAKAEEEETNWLTEFWENISQSQAFWKR
jgi:hypothetical protein